MPCRHSAYGFRLNSIAIWGARLSSHRQRINSCFPSPLKASMLLDSPSPESPLERIDHIAGVRLPAEHTAGQATPVSGLSGLSSRYADTKSSRGSASWHMIARWWPCRHIVLAIDCTYWLLPVPLSRYPWQISILTWAAPPRPPSSNERTVAHDAITARRTVKLLSNIA